MEKYMILLCTAEFPHNLENSALAMKMIVQQSHKSRNHLSLAGSQSLMNGHSLKCINPGSSAVSPGAHWRNGASLSFISMYVTV